MNNPSWLQNNIAPLLAMTFTVFTLCIYTLVLTHVISATENITFLVINSLTNIMMIIIGYFYGSSAGSKQKQASLDKINDSTATTSISVKEEVNPNPKE